MHGAALLSPIWPKESDPAGTTRGLAGSKETVFLIAQVDPSQPTSTSQHLMLVCLCLRCTVFTKLSQTQNTGESAEAGRVVNVSWALCGQCVWQPPHPLSRPNARWEKKLLVLDMRLTDLLLVNWCEREWRQ